MFDLQIRRAFAAPARVWAFCHGAALLVLAVAVVFHVDLAQPVADPFQEAEYATIGPLARAIPGFVTPVLIHGGLDVVPSRLAASSCRPDAQLVCVRTLNTAVQLAAVLLLIAVLASLCGLGTTRALLASVPCAALLWFYDGATERIADAHQATPGVRDLCVLAALLLMTRLASRLDHRRPGAGTLELVALGLLAAASPFWAYNRGLVVIAVSGLFTLLLCAARRSPRAAMLATIGALAGIALIAATTGPTLFQHTLSDIRYWSQNSALWHAPVYPPTLVPALAAHLVAAALALPVAWSTLRTGRPGPILMTITLLVTGTLYTAQSLNRADLLHLRWTLWPATLLLGLGIAGRLEPAVPPRGAGAVMAATVLAGLCLEILSDHSIAGAVRYGLVRNARLLDAPAPSDRVLAGADLVLVADLVRASGRCTFAANNAGLVHLLSGQPPCSRFLFGAYVAADQQQSVIAELEESRPAIILWDATEWWAHVDHRSFAVRTPILARWIEANFPIETRTGSYTLRARSALPATTSPGMDGSLGHPDKK